MDLHRNFEEDVKELVLAREVNFSEPTGGRGELKSVSNLTKLADKKNCRQNALGPKHKLRTSNSFRHTHW
jgi:hypothetical protein